VSDRLLLMKMITTYKQTKKNFPEIVPFIRYVGKCGGAREAAYDNVTLRAIYAICISDN
jgi:hypothetical protein